jgi:hypothetical protein
VFRFMDYRTILGMIILIYVFSTTICSFHFKGKGEHSRDNHLPGLYCGGDLNNAVLSEDRGSSRAIFARYSILFTRVIEPSLPILSFAIFKPPKPAKIFL